jgi:hypothetical protein
MPKRQRASETTDARNILKLAITPRANYAINAWCEKTGGSKARFIELLVEFFAAAPDSMKQVMVGNIAGDMIDTYISLANKWFATRARGAAVVNDIDFIPPEDQPGVAGSLDSPPDESRGHAPKGKHPARSK